MSIDLLSQSAELSTKELRILVIEDELSDYELIVRQLKTAGFKFVSERVDSVQQLEVALTSFKPDTVLSDFSLPGFDGLSALELVRHNDPDLPFILVTGTLTDVMAFDAVKKGATDYVLKDRLERLVLTVARALNEHSEKKKLRLAQEAALGILRQRQEALSASSPTVTLRIIILEDNATDVALVDAELKKSGLSYNLVSSLDEAEFRAAIEKEKPHIFLADFAVPGFDGIAALQVREELCPEVPFIFLSGIMGEELAIEAVKAGATDYVMKHNLFAVPVAIKRALKEVHERKLRMEAEQGLEINDITRLITNNMAAALFLIDENGYCVFANPTAEKLTQFSFAELRGRVLHEKLHTNLNDSLACKTDECLLRRAGEIGTVRVRDQVCVRKDGTFASVLYSSTDIKLNGISKGCVIELLDVTNEKTMEQYSQNVAAINDELQTLAQVVSHELQEHVGKIRSYLNLLAVRYQGHLGSDADEFIGICTESASIVGQMVDDLWTYARINKVDVDQEYINSGAIAAATVEHFREQMEAANGTISFGKLPVVYSNSRQMAYLFRSLLDNALKFRSEKPPTIKIAARENGSMWIFSIEDNGIGIDPIHSKDVFKIFHRLNAKPSAGGTGMGLAIARKIIERNEGTIWFEPNESGGTTFYFSLPSHVAVRPTRSR